MGTPARATRSLSARGTPTARTRPVARGRRPAGARHPESPRRTRRDRGGGRCGRDSGRQISGREVAAARSPSIWATSVRGRADGASSEPTAPRRSGGEPRSGQIQYSGVVNSARVSSPLRRCAPWPGHRPARCRPGIAGDHGVRPTTERAPRVMGPRILAPAPRRRPRRAGSDAACRPRAATAERETVVQHDVVAQPPLSRHDDTMPWSMKKRRPIVAPGWISTPVSQRVTLRQGPRREAQPRRQSRFRDAVRPHGVKAGLQEGDLETAARAAGSRSLAEEMSSRRRERTPTSVFAQVLVERGREVALAV